MPKLDPCDTDSLGEQIQRALPGTKLVKSFVTQEQTTVVNPKAIGEGDHTMFVAGDHADAKQQVTDLLKAYGWTDILDLGPLVCARGMEMNAHMHSAIGFGLGHGSAATSASRSCAEPARPVGTSDLPRRLRPGSPAVDIAEERSQPTGTPSGARSGPSRAPTCEDSGGPGSGSAR